MVTFEVRAHCEFGGVKCFSVMNESDARTLADALKLSPEVNTVDIIRCDGADQIYISEWNR